MTGTDPTLTYSSGSHPYPDRMNVATRHDVAALRTELQALRSEIFKVSLSLESAKVRENFRAEFRLHDARLAGLVHGGLHSVLRDVFHGVARIALNLRR